MDMLATEEWRELLNTPKSLLLLVHVLASGEGRELFNSLRKTCRLKSKILCLLVATLASGLASGPASITDRGLSLRANANADALYDYSAKG